MKDLENTLVSILVYVTEILPPSGRLNDKPGENERYFVILNEVKNLNT